MRSSCSGLLDQAASQSISQKMLLVNQPQDESQVVEQHAALCSRQLSFWRCNCTVAQRKQGLVDVATRSPYSLLLSLLKAEGLISLAGNNTGLSKADEITVALSASKALRDERADLHPSATFLTLFSRERSQCFTSGTDSRPIVCASSLQSTCHQRVIAACC